MEGRKEHLINSTAVASVSSAAAAGFIAFAKRTAEISPQFEPLQYAPVIISTIVSAYLAYGAFELLKKYSERPYEFFMYLAGLTLIFSYMPIGHVALEMEAAGMPEINVLGTLHAVVAVFIVSGIAKIELMRKNRS